MLNCRNCKINFAKLDAKNPFRYFVAFLCSNRFSRYSFPRTANFLKNMKDKKKRNEKVSSLLIKGL